MDHVYFERIEIMIWSEQKQVQIQIKLVDLLCFIIRTGMNSNKYVKIVYRL